MLYRITLGICFLWMVMMGKAQTDANGLAVLPKPTQAQLAWQNQHLYLFVHFGPNTFTDKEWGLGNEPENVFNPSALNCEQWARIAKAAGAKGLIITAKHHDGFCLWPSKYSTHTVAQSKWLNGKGDVLKACEVACKKYGLSFGVYLSPWDRNHPQYGTPGYNAVFVNMLKEIFTNYGPITELWWDGANGEGPNGKKQIYDWPLFIQTVRKLSPQTLIFSDVGPDIRWVGNEKGIAGTTNWNTLDTATFSPGIGAPPADTLQTGNYNGCCYIPAECDVSIRPGWFYHSNEDSLVKTPLQLWNIYTKSVGRGANLLLNVPPNRKGLFNSEDSLALMQFKQLREEAFAKNLLQRGAMVTTNHTNRKDVKRRYPAYHYIFKESVSMNCVVLEEDLTKGQAISSVNISISINGEVQQTIPITTVGHQRMVFFPTCKATELSVVVSGAKNLPYLKQIAAYQLPEKLLQAVL
ncbi:alpha-L-fucosidase [Hydrotalea sandarakina]|uniref:alpha-L-fucosidase n=1 Tax=Hydrotalea sandarakina TaxID=1004304 RepID=A0A2W7RWE0_9BACT|nr:alpha-L-fucosidase [Hydrotalea sandarakina]PZX64634.1 alpha-L-fucosidase [Hydrotalea sandarakina]